VVPIDDVVVAADPAPEIPPSAPPPDEPIAAPADDDRDAVRRALEGVRKAEELHRQQATAQRQPSEHEAYVNSLPGLSDRKRNFLKANPALLRQDVAPIAGEHYQNGLAAGLADDSAELERFVLEKTTQSLEHRRQLRSAPVEPEPAVDPEIEKAARELEAEAEALQREYLAPQPMPQAALPRRSIPVSAPVSRGAPSLATGRPMSMSNRTLSAAEVEIAHNSFTDSTMSNRDKELLYLQNREKLHRMRASGEYRMTSEQGGG
jgi:hypothetical protein